ncbi:contactin-3-like isoform X2 [Actinia tenebrosa]|nr:contactin-3-like isoform X2 [Actinia tenebrosa]
MEGTHYKCLIFLFFFYSLNTGGFSQETFTRKPYADIEDEEPLDQEDDYDAGASDAGSGGGGGGTESEPNGAPEALHILKNNATTYTATWNEVPEHLRNGLVINYEVRWIMIRKGNLSTPGHPPFTRCKVNGFSYTMHGLSLCAQYSISVRAYTRVGPGPYSAPVNITTQR